MWKSLKPVENAGIFAKKFSTNHSGKPLNIPLDFL
jgi:hypothetical protein